MIASFVMSGSAAAMTLSQMCALPGGSLIERRAVQVLEAYGPPAAVLEPKDSHLTQLVHWHASQMRLGRGTWKLIYQGRKEAAPAPGWRNPNPQMPKLLAEVSRLELVAAGGVGIVTINMAAHKTTYSVPSDQLRAHKIVAVTAHFAEPISPRSIVDRYGHGCEFVVGKTGRPVMRYWVLTEEYALPISLFAVDFELASDWNKVTGYAIRGVEARSVRRRFNAYYEHYLDLFSD